MGKKKAPAIRKLDDSVAAALKEGHREFLRYVGRRTGSLSEAEDVLQDFYVKVVRSAGSIRSEASLRGWMAQVLRRTLTDHYRSASVRKRGQKRLEAAESSTLHIDDEADRAVCGCVYRILPTLSADYGQIIWRVDLLGHSRAKVAKSLGITVNNLGVRIHRARHALRTALERFCVTCPEHGFLNCACAEVLSRSGSGREDLRSMRVMNRRGGRLGAT